jgi:uracil-DNA glycosylase family protein
MLVGEQPGDQEDRQGHPFVGPAGRLLDAALAEAGIDRRRVYITNAVKHFKFVVIERGRRLHKKPTAAEVRACNPWLREEIRLVKSRVVVALGATAAQALLGKQFRVTQNRGKPLPSLLGSPSTGRRKGRGQAAVRCRFESRRAIPEGPSSGSPLIRLVLTQVPPAEHICRDR